MDLYGPQVDEAETGLLLVVLSLDQSAQVADVQVAGT